jgi:hypothetical protein
MPAELSWLKPWDDTATSFKKPPACSRGESSHLSVSLVMVFRGDNEMLLQTVCSTPTFIVQYQHTFLLSQLGHRKPHFSHVSVTALYGLR